MTREEASRINGAKSHGPVTEEGKERSSRNRTSHGLAGDTPVLPGEDQDMFDELTEEYIAEYKPQTPTERDFVMEIIACTWRLRRVYSMEREQIELEMARRQTKVDKERQELSPIGRITLAVEKLADEGKSLALLSRYETRHRRARERALAGLLAAIARRPKPDQSPVAPSAGPDTAQPETSPTSRSTVFPFEPETTEVAQNKAQAAPITSMAFSTCTAGSLSPLPKRFVATVLNHILEEERVIETLSMSA